MIYCSAFDGIGNLFKDNLILVIFTDIYHGRGNGGESIFGTVFEGKYTFISLSN